MSYQVARSFLILADIFADFMEKFAKLNKGGLLTIKTGGVTPFQTETGTYLVHLVEIYGTFEGIPGFDVIGQLEDIDGARFSTTFDYGRPLQSVVRSAPLSCLHCGGARNRVKTFVLANQDGSAQFQVGTKCVEHFTGQSADFTAQLVKFFAFCTNYDIRNPDHEEGMGTSSRAYNVRDFIAYAMQVSTITKGYIKGETGGTVLSALSDGFIKFTPEEYQDQVNTIIEIITSDKSDSEYMQNLKSAVEIEYVSFKKLALVMSSVSLYWRAKQRADVVPVLNEYLDDAALINLTVTVEKTTAVSTMYGNTLMVRMRTAAGHVIVFWDNKCQFEAGQTVTIKKAKVKKHDTYKGEFQTVIFYAKFQ